MVISQAARKWYRSKAPAERFQQNAFLSVHGFLNLFFVKACELIIVPTFCFVNQFRTFYIYYSGTSIVIVGNDAYVVPPAE